ncbi:MAG: hypothetical protein ABW182_11895 [Sphingomonas sp.]
MVRTKVAILALTAMAGACAPHAQRGDPVTVRYSTISGFEIDPGKPFQFDTPTCRLKSADAAAMRTSLARAREPREQEEYEREVDRRRARSPLGPIFRVEVGKPGSGLVAHIPGRVDSRQTRVPVVINDVVWQFDAADIATMHGIAERSGCAPRLRAL